MAQNPILSQILRRAAQVKDPEKRRRYTRAAVSTGIVESGMKNLNYGDADSQGWRQERASLYKNPTNVKASVDRFFNELSQLDRGQSAGELAADVQRPAAQYRGRYAQEMDRAVKMIQGAGGVRGGAAAAGGGGGGRTPKYLKFDPGNTQSLIGLALQSSRPQISASAPALPSFVTGAGAPSAPSAAPSRGGSTIDDAIAQIQQASDNQISSAMGGGSKLPGRKGGGGAKGGGGQPRGKYNVKELFWQGPGGINVKDNQKVNQGFVTGHTDHVHVAAGRNGIVTLGKLAQKMGLNVGENPKFGGVDPVHVPNSNHYSGQAIDVSGDPALMRKYAQRVARLRGG